MDSPTSKSIIAFIAFFATIYGHLNKLVPAVSGGSMISILFILISSLALITLLYKAALNIKKNKKSSIGDFEYKASVYTKLQIWGSRIIIAIILFVMPFGIRYNLKKMDERAIHFITSSVAYDSNALTLYFNISNNTGSKIFLTSFELLEYKELMLYMHDVGYDSLGNMIQYYITLVPDSTLNGLSYVIEDGNILPFKAKIYYDKRRGGTVKTFGIKFKYNDIKGNTYFKGSDAIYMVECDEYPIKINYLRFLNQDSIQFYEQKLKDLDWASKSIFEREYFPDAAKIFEKHSKLGQ